MSQEGTLSVVIPAYNEERFIGTLLDRVRAVDLSDLGLRAEIIVVDDCSRDRTGAIAGAVAGVRVHRHTVNQGKGAAVRTGLALASGSCIVIQDADLEYEPDDYRPMLQALIETGCDAVYGSRYLGDPARGRLVNLIAGRHPGQTWAAYAGGRSLSAAALAFTGRWLSDTVTALKLFRREALEGLDLRTSGFELDHEITAKLLARGRTIREVRIRYAPRSREEGKKIGIRDWFAAVRTFARYRRG
jgi:dolichol-phosphate mannosyltransferase